MVEEPRLTADEIVEQAVAYVLVASNGESIMGRASCATNPYDLLHLARELHTQAYRIEELVFE